MKRLTEQHYKKTDGYYMKCSEHCCKEDFSCEECEKFDELVDRLAAIEDILGDEYELDRLRKLVEADREGRRIPKGYALIKLETLEELEQQAALKAREQE